jgi:hypothetical protein
MESFLNANSSSHSFPCSRTPMHPGRCLPFYARKEEGATVLAWVSGAAVSATGASMAADWGAEAAPRGVDLVGITSLSVGDGQHARGGDGGGCHGGEVGGG